MPEALTFYFDPMCPYAFQTSLWIRDVRRQRALDITWRFFSLEEVNLVAGKRHPWERPWSFGFGQMRVGALIRRELATMSSTAGTQRSATRFFFDGVKMHVPEEHARVIAEAGFDPSFVARAVAVESTLTEVRDEHLDAVARYGAPASDARARRGLRGLRAGRRARADRRGRGSHCGSSFAECNGFRSCTSSAPKTMDDLVSVADHFRTYLTTRDWQTVENPAP